MVVKIVGFHATTSASANVVQFRASQYGAFPNQIWRGMEAEPCYVRVKPATLFHPSFPEVHDMLLNGEMVDCKVPENVMKARVQGRVVICPTQESAQIMKDLVVNTTGRIPEDASVEVEPRRPRRSSPFKNKTLEVDESEDVVMLQKAKRAPVQPQDRCQAGTLKGEQCAN